MKRLLLLVPSLFLLLFFSGCQAKPLTVTGFLLDTFVSVSLYENGMETLLLDSLKLCREYDDLFSKTKPDSDISRINRSGGAPVTVSEDTAELLSIALDLGRRSNGKLDITIGAASALWDFKAETPALPDPEALRAAAETVDYRNVVLTGNTVTLRNPKTQLDLGAVAKGYIADKMAAFLREEGVTSAVINLGGNIYAVGNKSGNPFRIGVRAPVQGEAEAIGLVEAEDTSLVTSGIYERCFTLDGVLYHHILDSATGYPVNNELASVTILCPRSAEADALSTLCFALGRTGSEEFLKDFPDVSAVLIDRDGGIHTVGDITLYPAD